MQPCNIVLLVYLFIYVLRGMRVPFKYVHFFNLLSIEAVALTVPPLYYFM